MYDFTTIGALIGMALAIVLIIRKFHPGYWQVHCLGPLVVIVLLALRPIVGITVDPMIALPIGGLVCTVATGNMKSFGKFSEFGLAKVAGVSVLLLGASGNCFV